MPAMSADSGWPWPDIRWHDPQAMAIPAPPPTDRGAVVFLRAAGRSDDAFRSHGGRLNLVGDVEGPIRESRRDGERLRVELRHDEGERRAGARDEGETREGVCSKDSRHGPGLSRGACAEATRCGRRRRWREADRY